MARINRIDHDHAARPESRADLPGWYAAALAKQASSGLSVAEFAELVGVTPTTLYQWRRKLAAASGGGSGKADDRCAGPIGLVEVTVKRAAEVDGDEQGFVVRLVRDRSIEVLPGFDAGALRRLVEVLESC